MRENEFEKKVRQQMEELRLPLSDAVWPRVEKELGRKKKRRIIFFVVLAAGLGLLGYSGYTLLGPAPVPVALQRDRPLPSAPVAGDSGNARPAASDPDKRDQPGPVTRQSGSQQTTARQVTGDPGTGKKSDAGKNEDREISGNLVTHPYAAPIDGRKNDDTAGQRKLSPEQPVREEAKNPAGWPAATKEMLNKLPEEKAGVIAGNESLPPDSMAGKKKTTSKIRFGPDLSAGMASNRGGVFFSAANDNYSDPANSTGGGPAGSAVFPPSPVKAGISFRAGVAAERKVSARSSLSAGLRYTYFQERIRVGAFRDTSILSNSYLSGSRRITGIYRSEPHETYTNRYHFIELPFLYQLQLNKSGKMPLLWNTGLSVSYMVATNALVYDTAAGGTYYHNKNALNRLQASFLTGLSFRFGNPAGLQWSVGPELSLGLTRLVKQESFIEKRYLLYGGITARLLFPRLKQ